MVGCVGTQPPCTNCNYKHTHAHTVDISWPTSFACLLLCVHLLCFSFATVALLLWLICAQFFIITQSREAARISEQNQRSSTPKFVSNAVAIHHRQQALQYTPHNTDMFTKIQIAHRKQAKRSTSIYCNLQCVPSCVVLRLTPTHKNMKQFVCLRRRGKRNPLRSPASGIYVSKNSPILHISQKQLRQAETENCFIECRQEVLSDSLTLKIITHIYILAPTHTQTSSERSQTCHMDSNGEGTHGRGILVKLVGVKWVGNSHSACERWC